MQPHTVTVQTKQSGGAYGDTYAAPVQVRCWLEDSYRLVRDASGAQVASSAQLFTARANLSKFTIGTKVTTPYGRATLVLGNQMHDDGGIGAWQHLAVTLQ